MDAAGSQTGSVVHLRDPNSVLSNPHVLVLEDTLTNQELMHEMLSLMGNPALNIHSLDDKEARTDQLARLMELRRTGSIGDVITRLGHEQRET